MVSATAYSQTFSKQIEFENYDVNFLGALSIANGELLGTGFHFCDPDTTDNRRISCLSVFSTSELGVISSHQVIDSVFPIGQHNLTTFNDKTVVMGVEHGTEPVRLIEFEEGEYIGSYTVPKVDSLRPLPASMLSYNGKLYLSSQDENSSLSTVYSSIKCLDTAYNLLWNFEYKRGEKYNSCYSFQPTADGNLIFIHDYSDGPGAQGEAGVEIVKLDTNGQLVDTLVFPSLIMNDEPRMLSSRGGSVYFASQNIIIPDVWPRSFNGTINKLSADLDSVLWSVPLPVRPWHNNREYVIKNIQEAANGDIMVIGEAWDAGIDGSPNTTHLINHNGFAARLSADTGELQWLRVYQLPIENDLLDPIQDGGYISSELIHVHELPDGHFIVGGTAYYDGPQEAILKPAGETSSFVWLMNIDENGCLDGEECSENIIIDGEYRPTDGFLPVISSEHTWVYGYGFGFGSYPIHKTWSQDTVWDQGWYYELYESSNEDGSDADVTGLYVEANGRLMEKDGTGFYDRKVVFDITLIEGDTIVVEFEDDFESELYVESCDTVVFADGISRKRIILKCTNPPFPNAYPERVWIEGIGDVNGGISNCLLDVSETLICYSDVESTIYQADWAEECWLTTGTDDELESSDIVIHPNPSTDYINVITIDSKLTSYRISDISGRLLLTGAMPISQIDVSKLNPGLYVIELSSEAGSRVVSKFVKE